MTAVLPPSLIPGDILPWFNAPLIGRDSNFGIDKMGGKYILLLFFGSAANPACAEALRQVESRRDLFDDVRSLFFGVSIDPTDISEERIVTKLPGLRFFDDRERRISLACGSVTAATGPTAIDPFWLLVDPGLRVIGRFALRDGAAALTALAENLSQPMPEINAPVLVVPDVLDPGFRAELIDRYERYGGQPTGFMQNIGGKTVGRLDPNIKRRNDHEIADEEVRSALRQRLVRRLTPLIERAFSFRVTRIERYIVACYDSAEGGHFRAHRDNTTPGTAHRRFAVTINLNGDYQGGDLRFPEFGMRTYRAPPGGAVVFCCSLLHEATRVTAGRRYATLPFLYDDAAARVREANWHSLAETSGEYRADASQNAAAAE